MTRSVLSRALLAIPSVTGWREKLNLTAAEIESELTDTGSGTVTVEFGTTPATSWSYNAQTIDWYKFGPIVLYRVVLIATPTIGSGAGSLVMSSLPYTPADVSLSWTEVSDAQITWPGGRTMMHPLIATNATVAWRAFGSAVDQTFLTAADMTTGSAHSLGHVGIYWTTAG